MQKNTRGGSLKFGEYLQRIGKQAENKFNTINVKEAI
tara:strand:- start:79 stop:189 length:111 start_codon:yes stop_codon:yes gene_type:complete